MLNEHTTLKAGDIVVVDGHKKSLDVRCIVLIVDSDENKSYTQVMMCHDDLALASIVDVIVNSSDSGMGYDLVVETDLHSVIWKSQITKKIGKISPTFVERIMTHAADPDALLEGIQTGYSIRGVLDPRWQLKEIEGTQFRSLCLDCVSSLLVGSSVTLDIDIFTFCDENEIYRILHLVKEKELLLTRENVKAIQSLGLHRFDFWKNRFPKYDLALALYEAAFQVLQIAISPGEDPGLQETITKGRVPKAKPLHNSGRPIVTSPKLWINLDLYSDSVTDSLQLLTV